MNKMLLTEDTNRKKIELNEIYKFIGGSIFGYKLNNMMRDQRGYFTYDVSKVLENSFPENQYFKNSDMSLGTADKIIKITLLSNFPNIDNEDVIYNQKFISDNHQVKRTAVLSIDNLFIAQLDFKHLYYKSGLNVLEYSDQWLIDEIMDSFNIDLLKQIVVNMELSQYIEEYCEENREIKYRVKDGSEYFIKFIDNIEEALKKIDYIIPEEKHGIFKNEFLKFELAKYFNLCLDAKINDSEKNNEKVSKKINTVLEGLQEKPYSIRLITGICSALYLKNQSLNLARSIAYFQNTKKIVKFSEEIKNKVRELYIDSSATINKFGSGKKISLEMFNKYNEVASYITNTIEKFDNIQI
jgi:hypothetical protein